MWSEAGDEAGASEVFNRVILPVNRLVDQEAGIFYAVHKEILRRRSVIRTALARHPAQEMDARTARELESLLEEIYPSQANL